MKMSIQSVLNHLASIHLTKTSLQQELAKSEERSQIHHGKTDKLSMKFHRQGVFELRIIQILIQYVDEETNAAAGAYTTATEGLEKSGHSNNLVIHQPVPEQTEDVQVIVEKNFHEIVNDNSKDVLIYFYAPYDSLCLSFDDKYDKLAKELKEQSDIVIAKMDVNKNEVPKQYDVPKQYEVPGLPTIYFVPKNSKNNPRKYEGARVVDDLIDYLAKEATEPLHGYNRDGLKMEDAEDTTDDEL